MTSGERTGPGRSVGPYRLVEPLGRGGMGEVWLAEDPTGAAGGAPRLVAVKLLHPALAADAGVRARFAREVAALRRIASPFVAPLLDAGPEAPRPWLASAYVAGPTLADHVARHGPLAEGALRALARALAEALVAIHAVGVVHRDLTPRNVVLGPDGPRVVDFGIAWFPGAVPVTQGGTAVGTPAWMAPERLAAGGGEATPASDVWSWGAVMAYAAGGRGAGGGAAGLPGWLEPAVRAATAADPGARPTAAQLLAALDSAPAAPAGAPPPTTASPGPGPPDPDATHVLPGGPNTASSPPTTTTPGPGAGDRDATQVLPGAPGAGTPPPATASPGPVGPGGPGPDTTQVVPGGPRPAGARRRRRAASLVSGAAVVAAAVAVGAAAELLAAILVAAVLVLVALVLRHRRTRMTVKATRTRVPAGGARPAPAVPPTWAVALAAPAVVGAALVESLGPVPGLAALAVLVVVFVLVAGDLVA